MNIDLEFEKARNKVHSFIHKRVIDELYKLQLERIIAGENTILSHRIKSGAHIPINGDRPFLFPFEDEMDYIKRGYSPEQIKEMWENAKPKLSVHGSSFEALIITGTE